MPGMRAVTTRQETLDAFSYHVDLRVKSVKEAPQNRRRTIPSTCLPSCRAGRGEERRLPSPRREGVQSRYAQPPKTTEAIDMAEEETGPYA